MHELFDSKAGTANGERRADLPISGGATMWRPIRTLLRAFWPVRNRGRRDEKWRGPRTETFPHG